eukprot:467435_1
MSSLNSSIESYHALNHDTHASTASIEQLIFKQTIDKESYIVSDADEEILILIQFKQPVNLHRIEIHALTSKDDLKEHTNNNVIDDQMSTPKEILIYKIDNLNKDFHDIESIAQTDKSMTCSPKKLEKGQKISLKKQTKFRKIQFVAIFIKSNHSNTSKTFLNGIRFIGQDCKHQNKIIWSKKKVISEVSLNTVGNGSYKTMDEQIQFDKTDTENTKQFLQLHETYPTTAPNVLSPSSTKIDKYCGVNPYNISNDDKCILTKCQSLMRLIYLLQNYHVSIKQNEDNEVAIYQKVIYNNLQHQLSITRRNSEIQNNMYDESYDDTQLLNDYQHLLSAHAAEFEIIHHTLVEDSNDGIYCQLSKCHAVQRNRRDRYLLSNNENQVREMFFNANDNTEIIRQEFLDTIHCHYFHSFDTGFAFTDNEKEAIGKQVQQQHDETKTSDAENNDFVIEEIIKMVFPKQNTMKTVIGANEHNDKFKTIIEEKQDDTTSYYSFGHKFFYWEYFKNNVEFVEKYKPEREYLDGNLAPNPGYTLAQWYIAAKFRTFKSELLHNNVVCMSMGQYQRCLEKANKKHNTIHGRALQCRQISKVLSSFALYCIRPDDTISVDHILAIMVYCNFDYLQSKFSETYRRIPANETVESLQKRHSNYHHFGRLLREFVECFGDDESCFNS